MDQDAWQSREREEINVVSPNTTHTSRAERANECTSKDVWKKFMSVAASCFTSFWNIKEHALLLHIIFSLASRPAEAFHECIAVERRRSTVGDAKQMQQIKADDETSSAREECSSRKVQVIT